MTAPATVVIDQPAETVSATVDKLNAQFSQLEKYYDGLFEDEYRDDVIAYMQLMEASAMPSAELMDMQPELQWYMRPYLIDFLIEIHQQSVHYFKIFFSRFTQWTLRFRLRPETLYLALNVVDRYVSKRVVFKKHYQLVGCSALWIAAKFEDAKDRVPTVQDLAQMCCNAYDESAFIQMEGHVLSTLGWSLGAPSAEAWLRMACMSPGQFEDLRTQHCARFLMEVTLFHRDFINFKPSQIAAGALILARFICQRPRHVHEESPEAIRVAVLLDLIFGDRLPSLSEILIKKYSWNFYSAASTVVKDFFLAGRRFFYLAPSPALPHSGFMTPATHRDPSGGIWTVESSPTSSDSSVGEDDDMPITPTSIVGAIPICTQPPYTLSKENHGKLDFGKSDHVHIMSASRPPLGRLDHKINNNNSHP